MLSTRTPCHQPWKASNDSWPAPTGSYAELSQSLSPHAELSQSLSPHAELSQSLSPRAEL
jgi:hypothetical protein